MEIKYVLVTGNGDEFEETINAKSDDLAITEAKATIKALTSYDRNRLQYADLFAIVNGEAVECWDILAMLKAERYMVIDSYGSHWLDNGVSRQEAELFLADLIASGAVSEEDEPEVVEID